MKQSSPSKPVVLILIFIVIGTVILLLPREHPVTLPEQEAAFCTIIEKAASGYNSLSKQLNTEQNPIVASRLQPGLKSIYRTRNDEVFRLLERTNFNFENWKVVFKEIIGWGKAELHFHFRPFCSPITDIRAAVAATPANFEFLSKMKRNNGLIVTGIFVGKWTAFSGDGQVKIFNEVPTRRKPASSEDFEGSITESGSIREPEYNAVIKLVD